MRSLEAAACRFNRGSILALGILVFAALSACGGSGSTPSPKPSSPATTPTPSATPSSTATQNASSRYAGSMSQTVTTTYADPGPVPSGTPQAVGVQTLTWQSQVSVSASPAPGTNAIDEHTVDTEMQTSPAQVTLTTSDAIYQLPAGGVGNLYVMSSTSVNGTPGVPVSNTTVATTYGSGNGLVDVLPETAGASWTNDGAMSQTENDPGGRTAQRSVAAGGAYTSTATSPQLGGGTSVTTRAIADNADGSGMYTQTDLLGVALDTISYAAPAAGSVVITLVGPSPSGSPSPSPSPSSPPATKTTVPVWFGVPVVLYTENDSVVGQVTVPGSCGLGAQFGSTGTEVDDSFTRTDTVLGTIEKQTRKTYDLAGTVLCMQSVDTYAAYYDYSGADVALIGFFGTNWQTTVTTQTLALTSSSVLPSSAMRATQSSGTSPSSATVFLRPVAFEAAVEKVRRDRERDVAARLSKKDVR